MHYSNNILNITIYYWKYRKIVSTHKVPTALWPGSVGIRGRGARPVDTLARGLGDATNYFWIFGCGST